MDRKPRNEPDDVFKGRETYICEYCGEELEEDDCDMFDGMHETCREKFRQDEMNELPPIIRNVIKAHLGFKEEKMLAELIPQLAGMDSRQWTYKPRPSSSGPERCVRAMVYNALGIEPKPLPGRAILIMDDSSWHEELTCDWIAKSNYKIHSRQMGVNCMELKSPFLDKEFKCEDKYDGKRLLYKGCNTLVPKHIVHGHIDGIIQEPDGTEHLFEHKAINHFTFAGYESGELIPYDYVSQCVLYDNALKTLLGKDLSYAILLIKNKNTSRYMEYHISFDDQQDIAQMEINKVEFNNEGFPQLEFVKEAYMENVLKSIKYKFEQVDKYYLEKTLPRRPYTIDSWHCDYCGWNNYCYKEYEKELAERLDNVKLEEETVKAIIELKERISIERLELEKEEKKIKHLVITEMMEKNGRTALADKYIVEMKAASTTSIDKKLIPNNILEKASKESKYEKLLIKRNATENPVSKRYSKKIKRGGKSK